MRPIEGGVSNGHMDIGKLVHTLGKILEALVVRHIGG